MTIAFTASVRNALLDARTAQIDLGAAGLLRIYDGVRPASGGAPTNLLAELTYSAGSFLAAVAGFVSANPITPEASAPFAGSNDATWFRSVDSSGTFVEDGDVGATGSEADLELNTVTITQGIEVSVSQFDVTAGNA